MKFIFVLALAFILIKLVYKVTKDVPDNYKPIVKNLYITAIAVMVVVWWWGITHLCTNIIGTKNYWFAIAIPVLFFYLDDGKLNELVVGDTN